MKVLVVEDHTQLADITKRALIEDGYVVDIAQDGQTALDMFELNGYDVIVLDIMLPEIDGIEVCQTMRKTDLDIPIIMLTARDGLGDRIKGLDSGADDYLVKPFSVPELLARIKTILRRVNPDAVAEQLKAGDLVLDRKTRRVNRGLRDINLSPTEFRLLEQLMKNPGRVYSRSQLLDTVWGRDAFVDERTVDVHVGRLRKSLSRGREADPVRTIRAMGYAFDERFGRTN
jgi:two-component system phosphate regulon response regulator PhoB